MGTAGVAHGGLRRQDSQRWNPGAAEQAKAIGIIVLPSPLATAGNLVELSFGRAARSNVSCWYETDLLLGVRHVRCQGMNGPSLYAPKVSV